MQRLGITPDLAARMASYRTARDQAIKDAVQKRAAQAGAALLRSGADAVDAAIAESGAAGPGSLRIGAGRPYPFERRSFPRTASVTRVRTIYATAISERAGLSRRASVSSPPRPGAGRGRGSHGSP